MSTKKVASGHHSVQIEAEERDGKQALCVRALLTGIALLILLQSARAQEPPKPGKEHDHLKRLVGTWDAETEYGTGTMTYKMGLGGLWLVGDFERRIRRHEVPGQVPGYLRLGDEEVPEHWRGFLLLRAQDHGRQLGQGQ